MYAANERSLSGADVSAADRAQGSTLFVGTATVILRYAGFTILTVGPISEMGFLLHELRAEQFIDLAFERPRRSLVRKTGRASAMNRGLKSSSRSHRRISPSICQCASLTAFSSVVNNVNSAEPGVVQSRAATGRANSASTWRSFAASATRSLLTSPKDVGGL
jgi:hypothetical protein